MISITITKAIDPMAEIIAQRSKKLTEAGVSESTLTRLKEINSSLTFPRVTLETNRFLAKDIKGICRQIARLQRPVEIHCAGLSTFLFKGDDPAMVLQELALSSTEKMLLKLNVSKAVIARLKEWSPTLDIDILDSALEIQKLKDDLGQGKTREKPTIIPGFDGGLSFILKAGFTKEDYSQELARFTIEQKAHQLRQEGWSDALVGELKKISPTLELNTIRMYDIDETVNFQKALNLPEKTVRFVASMALQMTRSPDRPTILFGSVGGVGNDPPVVGEYVVASPPCKIKEFMDAVIKIQDMRVQTFIKRAERQEYERDVFVRYMDPLRYIEVCREIKEEMDRRESQAKVNS